MKNLIYGSVLFLLGAGTAMSASAQSSGTVGKNSRTNPAFQNQSNVESNNVSNTSQGGTVVISSNTNPAYQNQTKVDAQNGSESTKVASTTSQNPSIVGDANMSKNDALPSAIAYLIEYCELKDGTYYLPKEKFLELTEQQQNILLTSVSKIKVKE